MNNAHENSITDAEGIAVGMVSPDGRDGMIQHAAEFEAAGIPFIFDPGQGLPMFNGEELLHFIEQATWLTVNDYEWELIRERTGLDETKIGDRVKALIITKGGEGSVIRNGKKRYEIPVARASQISDPTGCGDAYRAGLLHGILHDMDWETTGRLAALMGAMKIEAHGTQNHNFGQEQAQDLFEKNFGYRY
jgi:adenosine kinase